MATVIDGFTLLNDVQARIAILHAHSTLLLTALSSNGNKERLHRALADAQALCVALERLIEVVK